MSLVDLFAPPKPPKVPLTARVIGDGDAAKHARECLRQRIWKAKVGYRAPDEQAEEKSKRNRDWYMRNRDRHRRNMRFRNLRKRSAAIGGGNASTQAHGQ